MSFVIDCNLRKYKCNLALAFADNAVFFIGNYLRIELNIGTVPMFKMHHVGTFSTFQINHVGTVPMFKMHLIGTLKNF